MTLGAAWLELINIGTRELLRITVCMYVLLYVPTRVYVTLMEFKLTARERFHLF